MDVVTDIVASPSGRKYELRAMPLGIIEPAHFGPRWFAMSGQRLADALSVYRNRRRFDGGWIVRASALSAAGEDDEVVYSMRALDRDSAMHDLRTVARKISSGEMP
jgi:hypothetical protein